MSKVFHIAIEGGDDLGLDQIWPDHDGPADPTAADVVRVIEKSGFVDRWLSDWNMGTTIRVSVDGVEAKLR